MTSLYPVFQQNTTPLTTQMKGKPAYNTALHDRDDEL